MWEHKALFFFTKQNWMCSMIMCKNNTKNFKFTVGICQRFDWFAGYQWTKSNFFFVSEDTNERKTNTVWPCRCCETKANLSWHTLTLKSDRFETSATNKIMHLGTAYKFVTETLKRSIFFLYLCFPTHLTALLPLPLPSSLYQQWLWAR